MKTTRINGRIQPKNDVTNNNSIILELPNLSTRGANVARVIKGALKIADTPEAIFFLFTLLTPQG
jgi:hypothetical protein